MGVATVENAWPRTSIPKDMAVCYVWVWSINRAVHVHPDSNLTNYSTTAVVSPRSFLTIIRNSFRTGVLVPPQGPIPRLVMLDQK